MDAIGLVVAGAVLLAAVVFGVLRKVRDGRVRSVSRSASMPMDGQLASLGVRPGVVTLLQFSSAFCAPCRATRVICAEVARTTPGVSHIEVDAESHLQAVRALGIHRTPTVLIVAGDGRVVGRAHGVPKPQQIRDAIGVLHA